MKIKLIENSIKSYPRIIYVEAVLMANGEVIRKGKTIIWFNKGINGHDERIFEENEK